MSTTVMVTVEVPAGSCALLADVVAAEATRERAWLDEWRASITEFARLRLLPA
ncbi:hypothetical protein ABT160_30090 [Streptomyces sp. NPDC001941]|uniref:hypothetical protein n=1 Tax=Streptomyces sp. NPDC001941 TaxID=3154659 RepID=UPI00331DBE79